MHFAATFILALVGLGASMVPCNIGSDNPPRTHKCMHSSDDMEVPDLQELEQWCLLEERAGVRWDSKYDRPITSTNQVQNPFTGQLEDAYQEGSYFGPPYLDFFVNNIRLSPVENRFIGLRATLFATVDQVIAEIGAQVGSGEYEIMSISATKYSVVLLLMSDRTQVDLGDGVFEKMQRRLSRQYLEKYLEEKEKAEKNPQRVLKE